MRNKNLLGLLIIASLVIMSFDWKSFKGTEEKRFLEIRPSNHIARENQYLLIFSLEDTSVANISVFIPRDTSAVFSMSARSERASVIESVERMVTSQFVLNAIKCIEYPYHKNADTAISIVDRTSGKTVKGLLQSDTNSGAIQRILNTDVPYARIQLTGWDVKRISLTGGNNRTCSGNTLALSIDLNQGVNKIYWEYRGASDELLGVDSVSIYYVTPLERDFIPSGYILEPFHRSSREVQCISCHTDTTTTPKKMLCTSCHGKLASQNNVHAPVGAGDCSSCHSEEADSGYGIRYKVAEESQTCLGCHDTVAKELNSLLNIHPPVKEGKCTTCHSPHGSKYAKQLRQRVNDQCFTCHKEKRDGNHPVVFHPVGDRIDPNKPENELSCLSCHAHHSSDNFDLMLVSGGYYALCKTCHQK